MNTIMHGLLKFGVVPLAFCAKNLGTNLGKKHMSFFFYEIPRIREMHNLRILTGANSSLLSIASPHDTLSETLSGSILELILIHVQLPYALDLQTIATREQRR